jgi:Icc protein
MGFSFIHITDHHICPSDHDLLNGSSPNLRFSRVLQEIARRHADEVDFIFSTGDLVDSASIESYQTLRRILGLNGSAISAPGPLQINAQGLHHFPIYFIPGNHDDRNLFYAQLFQSPKPVPGSAGVALMNAKFIHKGIQFVCLDWGPNTEATIQPETMDFLVEALESNQPSILMMHHHMTPVGVIWLDRFIAKDVERFWERLAGKQILGIFFGHMHISYERQPGGVPTFGLRSTAFSFALEDEPQVIMPPAQYRLVKVEDQELSSQVFEAP